MEESEGLCQTPLANLQQKMLAAYAIPHWTALKNSALVVESAALTHYGHCSILANQSEPPAIFFVYSLDSVDSKL